MPPKHLTLGIDLGGTNLKLALVQSSGIIFKSKLVPVSYKDSPKNVLSKVAWETKAFLNENHLTQVTCVGMGIAGDVDSQKGIVRFSPNLNWKNVPVKKILSEKVNSRILIDNDANCAAWGAYCLETKRKCDVLVCLTLGTGIGGGIILNKKIYRGTTGSAGELGHMSIQYQGNLCKCGSLGCVESYVGATSLIHQAEVALKEGKAPILQKLLQDPGQDAVNPHTLEIAALKGDPFCIELWKTAGERLGFALTNIVNIFNPDRIILCGGVSKAGSLILDPAVQTLQKRAFEAPVRTVGVCGLTASWPGS